MIQCFEKPNIDDNVVFKKYCKRYQKVALIVKEKIVNGIEIDVPD